MMGPIATPPPQRMLIPITFYSDFVCPWCFLGKRSLDAVMKRFIARHPEVEFEVTYKPYYICPIVEVTDKKTLFQQAIGTEDEYNAYVDKINVAAKPYGIHVRIEGLVGPSRNAHKLVALAHRRHGYQVQARVVDKIFSEQFEHGRDIFTNDDCLLQIGAAAAGLTEQDIRLEFADDDAKTRIDREVEQASEHAAVEAVPCVMVLGRFKVGGYQDEQVFENLFQKIYSEQLM